MKVKICGLQDMESAQFAVHQGADAIGFVFARSKREVSSHLAKEIISQLPNTIKKVGVFVNPSREMIDEVVSISGINVVQLHGDETPEFCETLPYPVIKAFSIGKYEDLEKIHHYSCEYVLLDGPRGKYHGGNGISFDWEMLTTFDFKGKKVILAGGLNVENVRSALKVQNVDIVDVSSGVETNGIKDLSKIKEFISTVKNSEFVS